MAAPASPVPGQETDDDGNSHEVSSQPASSFAFVDCSDSRLGRNPAARSVIRRHAMKEVGRSRRRPRQAKSVALDLAPLDAARTMRDRPSWWLSSGGLDPFVRYPIELDAEARRLVAFAFQDDEHAVQRPLRDAWFSVGLADEAAFLILLANSALHLSILQSPTHQPFESRSVMKFHLRATQSIARRLEDRKPSTLEGIIGALTALLAYCSILGAFDQWNVHHKGFLDMVKVRGGLDAIERNEILRVTASWCEIQGAFAQDIAPSLPLPRQWVAYTAMPQVSAVPSLAAVFNHFDRGREPSFLALPEASDWAAIYSTLAAWCTLSFDDTSFSASSADPPPPGLAGGWTIPMVHRLLSWRPSEAAKSSPVTAILETCRIGALLFMAPVWRSFGVHPVLSGVLTQKLKSQLLTPDMDWSSAWKFRLWALYLGACEARSGADGGASWFCEEMARDLRQYQVSSWTEARRIVGPILLPETLFKTRDITIGFEVERLLS